MPNRPAAGMELPPFQSSCSPDCASTRALRTLLSNLPGMAYRCRNDAAWTMEYVSEGCVALTGYPATDIMHNARLAWADLIHPADRAQVWTNVQAGVAAREPFRLTYRIRTAEGAERWVWEQGRGVFSAAGELLALEGFITDITAARQVEAALRESEERYRTLAESAEDLIFIIDRSDRVVYVNTFAAAQIGRKPEEIIGQSRARLFPPEIAARQAANLRRVLDTGQPLVVEDTLLFASGERWIQTNLVPLGRSHGLVQTVLGISRDITALKQAEQELQQYRVQLEELVAERTAELARVNEQLARDISERKRAADLLREQRDLGIALGATADLREALDCVLDAAMRISGMECGGIYVVDDASGGVELVSCRGLSPQFAAAVARYPADDPHVQVVMSGQRVYSFETPNPVVNEHLRAEGLQAICVIPVQHDGRTIGSLNLASRTCDTIPQPARDALEAIAFRIGGVIARGRTLQALRDSETRNRAIVAAIPDLVFRQRRDGVYLDVRASDPALLAVPQADLVGRSIRELPLPAAFIEQVMAAIERTLASGELQTLEYRLPVPRGLRDFEARLVPCGADEVLGVVRDITAQRRAEERARAHQEQLAHVARVSTLGEMISGLTHELAQPLTAMLYYARGCSARLQKGDWGAAEAAAAMEKIAAQADRAGEFIRRLKGFVRNAQPVRVPRALNPVVEDALGMAAPELRARQVAVQLRLAPDLPAVAIDPIQIEQVILNLVRNGMDAVMANPPGARFLEVTTAATPEAVHLTIQDNGPGVPAEDAPRIFEAFFTTKPAGTGLGLSISRSLIEAHHGRLWFEPAPERGALFGFTLPPTPEEPDGHENPDRLRSG
ncbi:MAG: PAS domain S-box protein [Planctomycetota bacterium]